MEEKKISDNIYEIKDKNSKVPVRIYASDVLFQNMKKDRTLIQALNVSKLPGIVKWAVVMPDGHEGYGFPVGGVAAFDLRNGIISPGGIGYDINCLPAGTKVITSLGYYLNIEELYRSEELISIDREGKYIRKGNVIYFLWRKENELIKIRTKCGFEIKVSKDHPIMTKEGMIEAGNIRVGDKVAIYPFEGLPYKEPDDKIILNCEEFEDSIVNELKKKELLQLTTKNPKLPYLIKLLGYFIGNGSFSRKNKNVVVFYGSKEGLEELSKDIERLGFKPSKIYHRKRKLVIDGKEIIRDEYIVYVNSISFKKLLIALGASLGKKTNVPFRLPNWIKDLPLWMKRLFLASYFGAKLNEPKTIDGYNFEKPYIEVHKVEKFGNNGIEFLEDIAKLLEEFEIEIDGIELIRRSDKGKLILRLYISEKPENLIKLWSRINYEYNPKRRRLALAAVAWLNYKLSLINIGKGSEIYTKEIYSNNERLQVIKLYKSSSNIGDYLMKFEDWVKESLEGDIIWDDVIKIDIEPYDGIVYDITIDDIAHDFIANNFVVSNCGVRVIRTNLTYEDVKPKLKELVDEIFRNIPAGVGETGKLTLSHGQFKDAVEEGLEWAYREGYAWKEDMYYVESYGRLKDASLDVVSDLAIRRGIDQLGTLGSGNHFLEIQVVDKIFDHEVAKILGIEKEGQVSIMIHTGSRGFGHQIASDYIELLMNRYRNRIKELPDRELIYADFNSEEGQNYWKAMSAAANFAWNNRQIITYFVRKSFEKVFKTSAENIGLNIIYDVAHNIAKIEEHDVDGKKIKVIVHRKGATRAFPPGHPELVEKYRSIGQPVLIPGSMGTASYILLGREKSMELSFGSSAHGAGRMLSRAAAKRKYTYNEVISKLQSAGILIKSTTKEGVIEEVPEAYKDVDEVVKVTHNLGISKIVVRLRPIAVIKG